MKIEHIGLSIARPVTAGRWYAKYLGFEILRELGTDDDGVVFMRDQGGTTIEIGCVPGISPLDFKKLNPLVVHLAIECENPAKEAERLMQAGAELIGESIRNDYAGEKILVRDPFGGLTIQLINRQAKLPG